MSTLMLWLEALGISQALVFFDDPRHSNKSAILFWVCIGMGIVSDTIMMTLGRAIFCAIFVWLPILWVWEKTRRAIADWRDRRAVASMWKR